MANSSSLPELVAELPSGAVPGPSRLLLEGVCPGGHDDQVLHVPPGEAGVGLQGQGGHGGGDGGRGRRASVLSRADVVRTQAGVLKMVKGRSS